MLYDVATPEDYLKALEDDWRKATLLELRELLLAEGLEEGIVYKMLGYSHAGQLVMCLNAQKAYVALYSGNVAAGDPDGSLLKGLSLGKGCVRFSKTKVVAETGVGSFIKTLAARARAGEDVGC